MKKDTKISNLEQTPGWLTVGQLITHRRIDRKLSGRYHLPAVLRFTSRMDSPTSSTTEYCTIETDDNLKLDTRIFKPQPAAPQSSAPVIVLVHPYSIMGGCQGLMKGMARGLANRGFIAVTFDMRGTGRSTGRPSITGFSEVNDVVSVCNWATENLSADRIILVASSAGAPIAGSAVDKVKEVIGYVSIGYPFGFAASILFGRHNKAILQSPKPKLFVMGTQDGFTSVKQLQNKLKSAAGRTESHLIEGAGHFQMEGPAFDAQMVYSYEYPTTWLVAEKNMEFHEWKMPMTATGDTVYCVTCQGHSTMFLRAANFSCR